MNYTKVIMCNLKRNINLFVSKYLEAFNLWLLSNMHGTVALKAGEQLKLAVYNLKDESFFEISLYYKKKQIHSSTLNCNLENVSLILNEFKEQFNEFDFDSFSSAKEDLTGNRIFDANAKCIKNVLYEELADSNSAKNIPKYTDIFGYTSDFENKAIFTNPYFWDERCMAVICNNMKLSVEFSKTTTSNNNFYVKVALSSPDVKPSKKIYECIVETDDIDIFYSQTAAILSDIGFNVDSTNPLTVYAALN